MMLTTDTAFNPEPANSMQPSVVLNRLTETDSISSKTKQDENDDISLQNTPEFSLGIAEFCTQSQGFSLPTLTTRWQQDTAFIYPKNYCVVLFYSLFSFRFRHLLEKEAYRLHTDALLRRRSASSYVCVSPHVIFINKIISSFRIRVPGPAQQQQVHSAQNTSRSSWIPPSLTIVNLWRLYWQRRPVD